MIIASCAAAAGQTQQGVAKTKGKLNADGTVTPGKMLQGVTVKVHGRSAVLSNAQGSFSFVVPGGKYMLETVKKNGYQLTDPDLTSRQYTLSSNPVMVVLETPDERTDDELANERKIRRNLQRQLMQREDEIEALREENRITQEEYRKLLQELYAQQETSEKLIAKMVQYYSSIDYDQLDDFNRQISAYIINGDLARADSMIASKGDINSRVAALKQHQAANADEAAELAQRQQALQQSQAYAQKELADIAQDCHHKYEICKMQYRNDSAAYYIGLRASLDTANVQWQLDAGSYISEYLADYDRAMKFYQCARRNAMPNSADEAACLDAIGSVHYFKADYTQALEYCQRALEIRKNALGMQNSDVANSIAHIGLIYDSSGDSNKAMECIEQAIDIARELLGDNSISVATMIGNLGTVHESRGEYAEALECFEKQLNTVLAERGDNDPAAARCYNNIGVAYSASGDYTRAIEAYGKALDILTEIYGGDHPEIAINYNNTGVAYARSGDYNSALEYFTRALELSKHSVGDNHPSIAIRLNNIGGIYYYQGKYADAMECYMQSLSIRERLLGTKHPSVAESYSSIGMAYCALNEYDKAIDCHDRAYNIYCATIGADRPASAMCLVDKGEALYLQGNSDEARNCVEKALKVLAPLGDSNPNVTYAREWLDKINTTK